MGHGKSELTLEFFYEKGINPYIITMGTGMTTDRLFGGIDIKTLEKDGKIEYLIENSFMNHEYVIFEEMMDAPDFILEQLKDILSSGVFRNGTQVFNIKTNFIVACTNKTRAEFSKNDSLKALMERFPLELNVIWDNYTDAAYTTLLEKRFGVGSVDPIIPFLLQEYTKEGIVISPRIALDCYDVYQNCGPDALTFIAEFAKKPSIISTGIRKFGDVIKFKQLAMEAEHIMDKMKNNDVRSKEKKEILVADYQRFAQIRSEIRSFTVTDDLTQVFAQTVKVIDEYDANASIRFRRAQAALAGKEENPEIEAV